MSTELSDGTRVLLVGDDELLLKEYALALRANSFQVETATRGGAASDLLASQSFDAAVVDVDTQRLNAARLIELIRAGNQDMRVLALGQAAPEAAAQSGATSYLVKPIDPQTLVGVVCGVLQRQRVAEANRQALGLAGATLTRRAAGAEAAEQNVLSTLDAVLECAPAFILVVNTQGKIKFINKVMTHHDRDDVIGSDWLQYLPPAEHEQHRARLQRILATGAFETYETTVVGAGGEALWFSAHMGPMRHGDAIVGAVLVSQDVTELKRAQADWTAAQRLAALGTLAAGIAHEINTPVQFVSDSVHFLREAMTNMFALIESLQKVSRLAAQGAPAPELQAAIALAAATEGDADLEYAYENVPKALDLCAEGLSRVKNIVRSMKEFGHPAERDMAPVDLNRAIETTLTIARHEYKYVAELETELSELPSVVCHVNDINQVLLNLLVNAAHAIAETLQGSDKKGAIKVRSWQEGANVLIAVSDTGAGIPNDIAPRIFEPFFTTKGVGKGTGQGLSLAWNLIREKHGGDLRFTSKVGEGTTFFIELPIAGKPAQPSLQQSPRR